MAGRHEDQLSPEVPQCRLGQALDECFAVMTQSALVDGEQVDRRTKAGSIVSCRVPSTISALRPAQVVAVRRFTLPDGEISTIESTRSAAAQ
jgi:hypothetical protein